MAVFRYGETELTWLRSRDDRLGEAIDAIGPVRREVDPDLFSSVMHHIIGQQISTKAQATIWTRMRERLSEATPETGLAAGEDELFAKYRRRYSPYGSTASLYLWAIAGGEIPDMRDWAPKKKPSKGTSRKKAA